MKIPSNPTPSPTTAQLKELRARAVENDDRYTQRAVDRALRGNEADLLACAMCL